MSSKGTLKRLGVALSSLTSQEVKVICLILTMVRQYCAADSLRGHILMPLSVLPWAQQLPGPRLTQLLMEAPLRVVRQWRGKAKGHQHLC